MQRPLILAVMLALSGCTTAAERAEQQRVEHDAYCKSIGVGPGTPGYADCRLRMLQVSATEEAGRRQAAATNNATMNAIIWGQ